MRSFTRSCVLALTLLLVVGWCTTSHAVTRYAAPSGSATCNNSTASGPYINGLAAGVACLNSGDTLVLGCGTYAERLSQGAVPSGTASTYTTLQAASMRCAVLQPGGSGDTLQFGGSQQYILLDGLVIDGSSASYGYGIRLYSNSNNFTIRNTELRNIPGNNNADNRGGISFGAQNAFTTVQNCLFHDIGNNDVDDGRCSACYSYGIYLSANYVIVEQSEFYNISGYAIHNSGTDAGGGYFHDMVLRNNYFHDTGTILMTWPDGNNDTVYNNVLVRVGSGVYPFDRMGIRVRGTSHKIYNNTIYQSGRSDDTTHPGYCIDLQGTGNTAQNNICYLNQTNTITNLGGNVGCPGGSPNCNLFSNPSFVNVGGNDYHLQSGSPAINQGVDLSSLFTTDKDGRTRGVGGAWDIGAYEFGGTGLPAPTNLRFTN